MRTEWRVGRGLVLAGTKWFNKRGMRGGVMMMEGMVVWTKVMKNGLTPR
jgi:hypothetical protein